jgi:putative ABC transport system permease protein
VKVNQLGGLTRAVRNVARRKMRALLIIIALGFSMAIMISIPAGIMANQESTQRLTENFNSTISNMQEEINKTATLLECQAASESAQTIPTGPPTGTFPGAPPFGFRRQEVFVNETIGEEIGSIEGVKNVVPFFAKSSNVTTSEIINTPRGSFTISRPLYTIEGVCLNSSFIGDYSILPTNITAGRNLTEGDTGVLLMSSNLSIYYGVGVGGKVKIFGEPFTVVGIYEPANESRIQPREVYMNISDAQVITDNAGNVSRFDVYADDVSYVDGITSVIEAAYSELSVTTYKDCLTQLQTVQERYTETLSSAEATLSQTQTIANQEIIVAVVATSLIILFVMLYTVRERTKEIGTLKATGFSNWNVMSQFMLEGMILSLVAGLVGIAIGSIGAPILSGLLLPQINSFGSPGYQFANPGVSGLGTATATLDPQLMLLALGAAVLLGALGSLYPAWRASRTRPAEAMRYE